MDGIVGTGGVPTLFNPHELGEYAASMQNVDLGGEVVGCAKWGAAGGGGWTRLDSNRNEAGGWKRQCPPSWLCGWLANPALVFWMCPYELNPPPATLCNEPNGECTGPNLSPYNPNLPIPGPGEYLTELAYICLDENPSPGSNEFFNNERVLNGDLCPDCSTAAPAPDPDKKTLICHVPRGNPDNAHTIEIGNAAVPAHIAHGDPADSVGRGCGGGGTGDGLFVSDARQQPPASLAIGANIDLSLWQLSGKLPYEYFYGSGSARERAAGQLAALLQAHGLDDNGHATIGVTRLTAFGADAVTLDPPVRFSMAFVPENGSISVAVDVTNPEVTKAIEFLLDNTKNKGELDFTGWTFELESGMTLKGSTLTNAQAFSFSLNHDRIAQGLNDIRTMSTGIERPEGLQNHRR